VNEARRIAVHKSGVHRLFFVLVLVLILVLVCSSFVRLTTEDGKGGRRGGRRVEDSEEGVKQALGGGRDGGR
jgi:hypothetical protein